MARNRPRPLAHSVPRFNIASRCIHDVSVSSSQKLAVFTRGRGQDLNLDLGGRSCVLPRGMRAEPGVSYRPERNPRARPVLLNNSFLNLRARLLSS